MIIWNKSRLNIMIVRSSLIVLVIICVNFYYICDGIPLNPNDDVIFEEEWEETLSRWYGISTDGLESLKNLNVTLAKLEEYRKQIQESGCPDNIDAITKHHRHDPEIYMTASELITSKGYPCEDHNIVTEDGYILGVQRIPHGLHLRPGPRPVVFLQHGLGADSSNWISNLANQSFGFILADAGFDVWLGNMRGNTYSRRHKTLNPDHRKFWRFSFDEMARYDLPAMIKYALNVTGQRQLSYVGHSQGTLIGFIQFGQDKELGKMVKTFYALGPVTTVGAITSPIRLLAPVAKDIKFVLDLIGTGEFLPSSPLIKWLAANVCQNRRAFMCENLIFFFTGFDCVNMNVTRIPVYLAHTPAGTSTQNVLHFAQEVLSDKFQMFDYGSKVRNFFHYHKKTPPLYDASLIDTPVALYWGGQDRLADPTDVKRVIPKLKNLVINRYIEEYDHVDFIWGLDARWVFYEEIISHMKSMK